MNRKVRQFILNSPATELGQQFYKPLDQPALGSTRSPNNEVQLVIRPVLGMLISAAIFNRQGLSGSFSVGIDQKKCSVCLSIYKPSPPSSVGAKSFWKYHQIPTAVFPPLQWIFLTTLKIQYLSSLFFTTPVLNILRYQNFTPVSFQMVMSNSEQK